MTRLSLRVLLGIAITLLSSVLFAADAAQTPGHWGDFSCRMALKYGAVYRAGTVFNVKVGYYPTISVAEADHPGERPRSAASADTLRLLMAAAKLVNPSASRILFQSYAGECWQGDGSKPREPAGWKNITKAAW
jgi:hypothetical protein